MYEGAQITGNKIEAALILKNLYSLTTQSVPSATATKIITAANMGQTTSNHYHRRPSTSSSSEKSAASGGRANKLQHRHSMAAADKYKASSASSGGGVSYNHPQIESAAMYKLRDKRLDVTNGSGGIANENTGRPITISEMNAFNVERGGDEQQQQQPHSTTDRKLSKSYRGSVSTGANNSANISNSLTTNGNSKGGGGGDGANSIKTTSSTSSPSSVTAASKTKKEFYTVGEGYHKTDSCYYKTPDGGYQKLPPDSYHKMSEVCYNKMPDGSFRRLDNLTLPNNVSIPSDGGLSNQSQSHNKVRNHIIRFLKRSKSHTPATIKEMQKTKEKERDRDQQQQYQHQQQNHPHHQQQHRISTATGKHPASVNNNHSNHSNTSGSRKVVVTMMENGGLPIVATSKSANKREHSTRESTRGEHQSKHKVKYRIFLFQVLTGSRKFQESLSIYCMLYYDLAW